MLGKRAVIELTWLKKSDILFIIMHEAMLYRCYVFLAKGIIIDIALVIVINIKGIISESIFLGFFSGSFLNLDIDQSEL